MDGCSSLVEQIGWFHTVDGEPSFFSISIHFNGFVLLLQYWKRPFVDVGERWLCVVYPLEDEGAC